MLLRAGVAAGLVVDAAARFQELEIISICIALAEPLLAALLLVGLWTPAAGVAICALEIGIVLMAEGAIEPAVQRGVAGLSLALLGPGAWSIDARVFGRKRVEIQNFFQE